jgi:antitoxin ChpS
MVAIPGVALDELKLAPGASVSLSIEGGRLVVDPRRPRYTLDDLLAQCNRKARRGRQDRDWIDGAPVGRELI